MKKNTNNMNKKDLFGKANYNEQIITVVKIAVVVILVLGAVYLLTALATGEIKLGNTKKKETAEATIQYEEIIAGQIMNRKEEEYYVLICNFTADETTYYLSLKDGYSQVTDSLPFYLVDLEKGFNQNLIAGEDEGYQQKPTNVKDLRVTAPTLLKIKNGKITERVETDKKVTEYLEKIVQA